MSDTRQNSESRRTGTADARPRILIVAPRVVATFIEQDQRMLAEEFEVTLLSIRGWRDLAALNREIRRADLVLIWFLGRHALPAVLLARPRHILIVTVIGGFEVAWVPSVGYGIAPGSLKFLVSRFLAERATRILIVSNASHREAVVRFPKVSDNMRLVPNAVDTQRFSYGPARTRSGVLHVGHYGRSTLGVKNLIFLRDVTEALPDISFRLAGPVDDREGEDFVDALPHNVGWLGPRAGDELVRDYQSASVYFQPSLHESFSLAVAEAMSCGCIPVVSPWGALPELVGNEGIVLSEPSVDNAVSAIRDAMTWGDDRREAARSRIVEHYDLQRRRHSLVKLMEELLRSRDA